MWPVKELPVPNRPARGFTMVELLGVVAAIAVLSTLGWLTWFRQADHITDQAAQIELASWWRTVAADAATDGSGPAGHVEQAARTAGNQSQWRYLTGEDLQHDLILVDDDLDVEVLAADDPDSDPLALIDCARMVVPRSFDLPAAPVGPCHDPASAVFAALGPWWLDTDTDDDTPDVEGGDPLEALDGRGDLADTVGGWTVVSAPGSSVAASACAGAPATGETTTTTCRADGDHLELLHGSTVVSRAAHTGEMPPRPDLPEPGSGTLAAAYPTVLADDHLELLDRAVAAAHDDQQDALLDRLLDGNDAP